MKNKHNKRPDEPTLSQSRILGAPTFAAISAVEGLALNASSQARMEKLRDPDLSPEQRRAEIFRAYAKQSKRK